ncbi:STAS domain-containing protein [Xanthobacter sp. KR7-65]|uniref:STAS domain-containing protein n=1 Tax=Xanthobacter sp. KR7-65 TaxID=3156612 RepID=UPI0032B5D804
MNIDSTQLGPGQILISLAGRLDITGASEIETRFSALASHTQATLVDMSGVTFLASIGIRLILATAKSLRKHGGNMVLFGCDPQVERVLLTTGVNELTSIVATRDDAMRLVETPAS